MGNSNSQESQIPSQYRHLSQNQNNQQLLNQLYSQNQQLNVDSYYNSQGYNVPRGVPGSSANSQIKIEKAVPIKSELVINRTSLKLIKQTPDVYHLSFSYTFQSEAEISIYFAAVESINDETNLTSSILIIPSIQSKYEDKNNKFKIAPKENQTWDGSVFPLNISKINLNELFKYDGNYHYPLIIKCIIFGYDDRIKQINLKERNQHLLIVEQLRTNKIQKQFCSNKSQRQLKKLRIFLLTQIHQSSKINNSAYWIEEVFGIADSSLNQNSNKDCSICLSDKIDTIILPCRHMCLCYGCCQDLRLKASKCPICRQRKYFSMENFYKLVSANTQGQEVQQPPPKK